MKSPDILIIDDDRAICSALLLLLKRAKMKPKAIHRPKEVLPYLRTNRPDLILLDMNFKVETTGAEGLDMLKRIKSLDAALPVILMTGWATVQLAVQGMKLGASDFMAKPWDNKQLLTAIKTILDLQEDKSNEPADTKGFEHIVGEHPRILDVLKTAKKIARTNASVLIYGESGVGKELIAEAIHAESKRADRPFVKVNLGGISTSLFESELFGHKKGAFTDAYADRIGRFELADTGTIFLDEIGELALESQVKLLRVLQEKTFEVLGSSQSQKVDVRVISATNKQLEERIKVGAFREDLYYRINLIKIDVPPLRARASDIPLLVDHFIQNLSITYDKPELRVDVAAKAWLQQQHFKGNIRALKNLVERTVLMADEAVLTVQDFQQHYNNDGDLKKIDASVLLSLEEMEIQMIKNALRHHQNNVTKAANTLGITRSSMYRRLQKHGIDVEG